MSPRSRGALRPRFASKFPPSPNRGRRECRAPDAPAVSCAMGVVERTRAYRSHRNHPAFPAQWFTAYFVLSPATGLSCHRRPREVLLPGNLTPASGCQDHTTLPSASCALVSRTLRVHRSPPHVCDDHEAPLMAKRDGEDIAVICVSDKQKYFCKRGLTEGSKNRER